MPVDENEDPVAAAFAAAEIAQVDRAGAVGGALRAVRIEADARRRQFLEQVADRRGARLGNVFGGRSEEPTSELQSLMRISYAVFCLKKTTTPLLYTKHHVIY